MTAHELSYYNGSTLNIEIVIGDTEKKVNDVVIDTGFIHEFYGLKIPLEFSKLARNLYTGPVKLADGNPVDVQYVRTVIKSVQNCSLVRKIPIWTIFMTGRPVIGINFLREYKACFDGPNNKTTLEIKL